MTKSNSKSEKSAAQSSALIDHITGYVTNAISDADEAAATARVAHLREARPEATAEELVQSLIRQKCLQTGAVGAVTSGASLIPGLGTMASLTFGVAADIGMTFKMQAELVLEIAAVYEHQLTPEEKQRIILVVTGISAGSSVALEKVGQQIATKATEQLAQKSALKALPVLGVAASAGTNMAFTYLIGQRAHAYFSLGPEAMGDWSESVRALTGLDERLLIGWLTETTERSWQLASRSVKNAAGAVVVAGQSTGEVIMVQANRVKEIAGGLGQSTVNGISSTTGKMVEAGHWAGASVSNTAKAAAQTTVNTSLKVGETLTGWAGSAATSAVQTGKRAGEGIASGANSTTRAVKQGGRFVKGALSRKKSEVADEELETDQLVAEGDADEEPEIIFSANQAPTETDEVSAKESTSRWPSWLRRSKRNSEQPSSIQEDIADETADDP